MAHTTGLEKAGLKYITHAWVGAAAVLSGLISYSCTFKLFPCIPLVSSCVVEHTDMWILGLI